MIPAKHGARVPLNIRVTVNNPDRIEQLVQQARAEIEVSADRALSAIYWRHDCALWELRERSVRPWLADTIELRDSNGVVRLRVGRL